MPPEIELRVMRARLMDAGFLPWDIDRMSVNDVGTLLGYWAGKQRVHQFREEERRALNS